MPTAPMQRARREAARRSDVERQLGTGPGSRTTAPDAPRRSHETNHRPSADPDWLQNTWSDYKRKPQRHLREQLILHYMGGHVRRIAERMRSTLPDHIEVDDLMQQGYLGLVESIERFQPELGFKFETFSARRVSGSMQDWLRSQDHLPRLMRTRSRRIAAATERYRIMHGHEPTADELQHLLGLDEDAFDQCYQDRIAPMVVTFGALQGNEGDQGTSGMNLLEDCEHATPLQAIERGDLQRWVTRELDTRDGLIIILYYYETLTMREIGQALGCSESRISQRLDSILRRLRARLDEQAVLNEFRD
jgi:RNA polymerase sigma factor for flagellar operon FliA